MTLDEGSSIEDVIEGCLILLLATRALLDLGDGFVPVGLRNRNIANLANDLFLNRRATKICPATGTCILLDTAPGCRAGL